MAAQPGFGAGWLRLDEAVQQLCLEAGQNGNAQDMLDCSRPVHSSESQTAGAWECWQGRGTTSELQQAGCSPKRAADAQQQRPEDQLC